jgi:hypothetical protein
MIVLLNKGGVWTDKLNLLIWVHVINLVNDFNRIVLIMINFVSLGICLICLIVPLHKIASILLCLRLGPLIFFLIITERILINYCLGYIYLTYSMLMVIILCIILTTDDASVHVSAEYLTLNLLIKSHQMN